MIILKHWVLNFIQEVYDYDYGKGLKKYINQLYIVSIENQYNIFFNIVQEPLYYVVVTEWLTEEERLFLVDYCCCDYCTSYFKFFNTQYNKYGNCLKIPYGNHFIHIKGAREKYNLNHNL